MTRPLRTAGAALALFAGFSVLALLNTGGYRYGASDQAFYVPAILLSADPSLFPRDRDLLAAEARFMVFDELLGTVAAASPLPIPAFMFAAYVTMLAGVAAGAWAFGRALYSSRWTAVALVVAMSLRHRIAKTGVNTLEANFHPRILAFAIGLFALTACLRRRPYLALMLAFAAVPVHPTTGAWFAIAATVSVFLNHREMRATLAIMCIAIAASMGWLVIGGPLRGRLVVMDAEWLAALAQKDYLFPSEWSLETWAMNLLYPVAIGLLFRARRRTGVSTAAERGLIIAMAVLFGIFLAAVPIVHARIALAVQLQVSRALWLLDFVAVALLVWWLVEAPWTKPQAATPSLRRWMVVLIAAAALGRGSYVTGVERAGDPLITFDVPQDDWGRAMTWLRATPVDTHVLADPGHAWRYGTSVRLAAQRDVYLEETKDSALALYSRDQAVRFLDRVQDLSGFSQLTPQRALDLASKADLSHLVTEADLDLPVAYRSGRLRIYRLRRVNRTN